MSPRLVLFAAAFAAIAGQALAAPDITGMWVLDQPPGAKPHLADAPLTAQERAKADVAAKRNAGGDLISEAHTKCWPAGMPGMMAPPFGIEILQGKDRIVILPEISNLPRNIYLSEASHPANLDPSWNGHSIGRWEGDVFRVDTVGLNGRQTRVTEKTHITEVFTLLEEGKYLQDEITIEDPAVYTRPYTVTYRYRRLPEATEVMEYVCEVDPDSLAAFEARAKGG